MKKAVAKRSECSQRTDRHRATEMHPTDSSRMYLLFTCSATIAQAEGNPSPPRNPSPLGPFSRRCAAHKGLLRAIHADTNRRFKPYHSFPKHRSSSRPALNASPSARPRHSHSSRAMQGRENTRLPSPITPADMSALCVVVLEHRTHGTTRELFSDGEGKRWSVSGALIRKECNQYSTVC